MKKFSIALGKAILYSLAFTLIQTAATILYLIYSTVSYMLKYPVLTTMEHDQAFSYILGMMAGDLSYVTIVSLLLANLLALIVVWLFFRLRKKKASQEVMLQKTDWKTLLASALIGMSIPFSVGLLINLIPFSEEMMENYLENSDFLNIETSLLTFMTTAIIGPIAEEVFFRGLVYTRLKRGMNPVFAAIISAALFGVGHGGMVWFTSAFLGGLILAWVFEKTQSLYAPIAIHIGNNAIADLTQDTIDIPIWLIVVSSLLLIASMIFLAKNSENRNQSLTSESNA